MLNAFKKVAIKIINKEKLSESVLQKVVQQIFLYHDNVWSETEKYEIAHCEV